MNLDGSFALCRGITRRHAKSFHFSSFALPAHKKDAACAVYAFCRHVDDAIDHGTGETRAGLELTLDGILEGEDFDLGFAPAFRDTIRRYEINPLWFRELIEGVCRDRGPVRVGNWEELRDYCYHVASVVGLIMASVFGLRNEEGRERAIDLGIAMQLTNILRDIREDLEADRIYLPCDELARFGVEEGELRRGVVTERFRALMRFQVARAREHYMRSERGIPMLDDDGSRFTVWMMRHVYAGILEEIEKADFDVFAGRVATSTGRKLLLAGKAWLDLRRTRHG